MATQGHVFGFGPRSEQRHGLQLAVTVRAYRLPPVAASLIDLSTGAAMLKVESHGFAVGDEVVLARGRQQLVSTVAWRKGRFLGLTFHRHLEPRDLAAMRSGESESA